MLVEQLEDEEDGKTSSSVLRNRRVTGCYHPVTLFMCEVGRKLYNSQAMR